MKLDALVDLLRLHTALQVRLLNIIKTYKILKTHLLF